MKTYPDIDTFLSENNLIRIEYKVNIESGEITIILPDSTVTFKPEIELTSFLSEIKNFVLKNGYEICGFWPHPKPWCGYHLVRKI